MSKSRCNRSPALRATLKTVAFSLMLLIAAILIHFIQSRLNYRIGTTAEEIKVKQSVIVDAGHGGRDGGAISLTGTPEKVINLSVAEKLSELLKMSGYNVIMTRTDDTALEMPGIKSLKMQDLKGRLNIINENPEAIFISIHMNKFPQEKYSGLQVYYSKNNKSSSELAELIKSSNSKFLQKENSRETKPAGTNIFLLHKAPVPAVMVECGFLSNPKEAELLDTDAHRMKIAGVIFSAMTDFTDK